MEHEAPSEYDSFPSSSTAHTNSPFTLVQSKEPPDADQVAKAIHDEARRNLEPISLKLRGLQVTSDPLSRGEKEAEVGEQVERLIREARSSKHLAQMYCGYAVVSSLSVG